MSKDVVRRDKLKFSILCDTERKVIRAYGLVHKGAGAGGTDIAIPAHVLIDRDGRILWTYVAKRIQNRISPDDLLSIVRSRLGNNASPTETS